MLHIYATAQNNIGGQLSQSPHDTGARKSVMYFLHSSTGKRSKDFHLLVTELVQLLVPEVRVQLDLVDCWLDLGVLEQVLDLLHTEVGDTNALD